MKRAPRLHSPPSKRHCDDGYSRSTRGQVCAYQNCDRPRWEKSAGVFHQFCGRMHYNFHMEELHGIQDNCAARDHGFGRDMRCRLAGCDKQVYVDLDCRIHDFCGRSHMLEYITRSTREYYKLGRICKIQNCYRLAYVEDNKVHDYCGLRHAKLAAAAKGAGTDVHKKDNRMPEVTGEEINSNSDQDQDSEWVNLAVRNQETEKHRLPNKDDFGHSGFDGLIPDHQLREYLRAAQSVLLDDCFQERTSDGNLNKVNIFQGADGSKFRQVNIFQGAEISKFHPWEIVTESKPRYLLTITSKTKVSRQTRDGRCWKQTGPPYTKLSGLLCKYFGYKQTNVSKQKPVARRQRTAKDNWTLHEYFLDDKVLTDLATSKGITLTKGAKELNPRRPVIMKIFRGDNADHGVAEDMTGLQSDVKIVPAIARENSGHMESAVSEMIPSSSGIYDLENIGDQEAFFAHSNHTLCPIHSPTADMDTAPHQEVDNFWCYHPFPNYP
ncbi:hypothetical protein Mapa_006808 [Marchantia paleacea]|nr:hypothetical protein Mapa_006808 [Marchantia paleacea]